MFEILLIENSDFSFMNLLYEQIEVDESEQ